MKYLTYLMLCLTSVFFLSFSCEDFTKETYDIRLENLCGDSIYYMDWDRAITAKEVFLNIEGGAYKLANNESAIIEHNIELPYPLVIIIFKKSSIEKYGLQYIIENNYYDKCFQYSNEDLQNMDFRITYTGK